MGNTYTAFINPKHDVTIRRAIAGEIISYIKKRTSEGKGIGGAPFNGPDGNNRYSKTYQEHQDFDIAGKTGQKTVNLRLTGDMMDSLEVLDVSLAGRIVVGYKDGFESDKSVWMREKGYDFLGLSEEELKNIVSKFDKDVPTSSITRSFAESFIRGIFGNN